MNEKVEQRIIEEKVKLYIEKYGKKALEHAIKDQKEKYEHFDNKDFLDILYYEEEEPKHVLVVGNLGKYGDYLLSQISQNSEIILIRRKNETIYPMEKIEKGDFL